MYDVAILGGGISGLYLAYELLKRRKRILLIEKSQIMGGRVHTYKDAHMSVEAGAGRIHAGHRRMLGLIRELGLSNLLVKIDNDSRFVREDGQIVEEPYRPVVSSLLREAKKHRKSELIGKTLFEFAVEVVGKDLADLALDSFGYTTEFLVMNAYDALELMKIVALHNDYYVLSGGLSQVVEALVERIKRLGGMIVQGRSVEAIRYRERDNGAHVAPDRGPYTIFCSSAHQGVGDTYSAKRCVVTFTARDVGGLHFLGDAEFKDRAKEWKHAIKSSIYGGSLCRIYSKFAKAVPSDDAWFAEFAKRRHCVPLGKLTIDNDLRMIIPIDAKSGVVMIAYSDGKVANKWAKMEEQEGVREVNRRLKMLVEEGIRIKIGAPKHTKIFHWSDAVGYWRVGADSARVERMATNGFFGLHFAGENYSRLNQQWLEGALDTAEGVLHKILT